MDLQRDVRVDELMELIEKHAHVLRVCMTGLEHTVLRVVGLGTDARRHVQLEQPSMLQGR